MSNSIMIHCEADAFGDCPFCDGRSCRKCAQECQPTAHDQSSCRHDTIERHLPQGTNFDVTPLVRANYKQARHAMTYQQGASAMTQGQTLGRSPKNSSNVRVEQHIDGGQRPEDMSQGYTFSLCLHGEWFRSHKFYKSRLDAETAAFRVSRKLNITLRGL